VGEVFVFGRVGGPSDALFAFQNPDGGLRLGWTQSPGDPIFYQGRLLYTRGNQMFIWTETPVRRDGGTNLLPVFPEASHPSASSLLPCPASALFQVPGGEVWARCGATMQKGSARVAVTDEDEVLGGGPSVVLLRRAGALFVAGESGRTAVQGVPPEREFGVNARGTSGRFDLIAEDTSAGTCYRVAISLDGGYAEEEQDHVPLFETVLPDGGIDQRGVRCTKARLAPTGDLTYFPVTRPAAGLYVVPTGSSRDAGVLLLGASGYDLARTPPLLTLDQSLEDTFVVVPY
jgi:hypothetical protein